jgi:hypothetical protein
VNNDRAFPSEEAVELPQISEIGQGIDETREGGQLQDVYPSLPGEVSHVTLVPCDLPGDETSAKPASPVQSLGEVHYMDGRPAYVQASDDPVNENGGWHGIRESPVPTCGMAESPGSLSFRPCSFL